MNDTFNLIVFHLSDFIILIPFCIAGIKNKQFKKYAPVLTIITAYLVITTIIAAFMAILWQYKMNNLFLFHIDIVVRFIMLMLFYRQLLKKIPTTGDKLVKRKIFSILIVLFLAFAIINALFIQPITENPSNTVIIAHAIILICALGYKYDRCYYDPVPIANTERIIFKFYKLPVFWINTGIIIYTSSSSVIYAISNMLLNPNAKDIAIAAWVMHAIFNIILYTCIAIGLYKFSTTPVDVSDTVFKDHKPKSLLGKFCYWLTR